MKRFVTYLYECERGNKVKNVGFIRVKVKEQETQMEVYIRNFLRGNDSGTIYVFIHKEELRSVELGEIQISNGQCDRYLVLSNENIMGSGCKIDDIEGIGIRMESGAYIVSCWRDGYEEEMIRGEFGVSKDEKKMLKSEVADIVERQRKDFVPEEMDVSLIQQKEYLTAAEELVLDETNAHEEMKSYEVAKYEKIDLSQIRDLPSPNWHLGTNSFLLHGFWNYGYLVLKKEVEGDEETLSLGVPGIFEKPEAVMAIVFGFPEFEEIAQEQAEKKPIEKDTEPKTGAFGGWFVKLKK